MVLADGFADPAKGPGGTWGLLVAAVICYLIFRVDRWRQQRRGGVEGAPPPADVPRPRHAAAGEPDTLEPPLVDDAPEVLPWYGRITQGVDGAWRRARHVAATGESSPRPAPRPPAGEVKPYVPPARVEPDDGFDAVLADDPLADDAFVKVEAPGLRPETAERYAARCLHKGVPKPAIVAGLAEHYAMPRATAYRLLGRLDGRSRAA